MPLPTDFAALCLHAGVIETPHFLFLQPSTSSGYIDLMVGTATGQNRMFSLNHKALFSNSGHPSGFYTGSSWSGDFYIDHHNWKVYYNTGSAWNTGVGMIGGTGGPGATGPAGAAGSGISGFSGGNIFEILTKNSSTNYDTSWKTLGDLQRGVYSRLGRPSQFQEVYRNLNLRSVSGSTVSTDMGSGCTYNPITNTIYVVDNGTPSIVEYSIDGQYIRTINLSGFKDVEAIDFMFQPYTGSAYFVICEEYDASGVAYLNKLHVIEISLTGSVTVTNNPGVGTHIREINLGPYLTNAAPNVGIEGVAYNPDRDVFYVITEKTANEGWKVWQVNNDTTVVIAELFDLTASLGFLSPPATDITDICYRRNHNTLVMTSEEGAGWIIEMDLDGNIKDFVVAPNAFHRLEGVTFTPNGQLMILTGEANTVGGDKPDMAIYAWNDGSNPSTNEQSHGLLYFQNGIATSLKGKIFELSDAYGTSTNNTNKSLTAVWPIGSRLLQADFIKRGRKLNFSSFGNFVPNLANTESAVLNFQVQDTGDAALTPLLSISGVSCHTTNCWSYDGQIVFSESGYYNKSYATIHNMSGFSSNGMVCSSGNSSIFTTGDIDFVTQFSVPTGDGVLNIFQFSIDID